MRLEPWHVIVLLLVVVVLFGYKRLPDAARSMGRSMRIFKSEVESMRKDDEKAPPTPPSEPLERSHRRRAPGCAAARPRRRRPTSVADLPVTPDRPL